VSAASLRVDILRANVFALAGDPAGAVNKLEAVRFYATDNRLRDAVSADEAVVNVAGTFKENVVASNTKPTVAPDGIPVP